MLTENKLAVKIEGEFACQVCNGAELEEVRGFAALPRVTSDCKAYPPGGRLTVCATCGTVQKLPDARWLTEIAEIYGAYDPYHQSGGIEQAVFDKDTGTPHRRSSKLIDRLVQTVDLPTTGQLLDVGCGSGAMLAAFADAFNGWKLYGADLDRRNMAALTRLPGFTELYTVAADNIPGRYDLISLIHSLEHITEPRQTLSALSNKLSPTGHLFIQVPDTSIWHFDLLVADHLCHFDPVTLSHLVTRAGIEVKHLADNWTVKELSLIARVPPTDKPLSPLSGPRRTLADVQAQVNWLQGLLETALVTATRGCFGLFGTSISATWLFSQMQDRVEFFVDEDPIRIGGRFMDRPVYAPDQAPAGATIYLALIPTVAAGVRERLRRLPLDLAMPPDFRCAA